MTGIAESLALLVITATVISYIAYKLNQPAVIAYLVTGILLGPAILSIAGETEATQIFSELGLVFLLFLIGLEINLKKVKEIAKPALITGTAQMLASTILIIPLTLLLGFKPVEAAVIGIACMFSSTALVVKMLSDLNESSSLPGRLNLGILLTQDLAVVLLMAVIGLNAGSPTAAALHLIEIIGLIAVVAVVSLLSSRKLLPKMLKHVSQDKHSFLIHGLAWAFVFISTAQFLNLSLEIGAFIAGLGFAQLPYSSELTERVRPMTDLFMAAFFINFGLKITPGSLLAIIPEALILSAAVMASKLIIFFVTLDRLKFTPSTSLKSALNLTQISEFSLIFAAVAASQNLIGSEIIGLISLTALITMGISSILIFNKQKAEKLLEPVIKLFEAEEKTDLEIKSVKDHAVVLGYDTLTQNLMDELEHQYSDIVIIDKNPDNVEKLAEQSHEFIFGDFRHSEIRESAAIRDAAIIISTASSFEVNKEVVEFSNHDTTLFVEADTVDQAEELYEMGADYVIVRNIIAGEKLGELLKTFFNNRQKFKEKAEQHKNSLNYGGS
ncbi:MAG: cation:proton antiporter [Candidatus Nanohaloarchaea archaeon]